MADWCISLLGMDAETKINITLQSPISSNISVHDDFSKKKKKKSLHNI